MRRHRARDLEPAAVRVREAVGGLVPAVARSSRLPKKASRSSARAAISRSSRRARGRAAAPTARTRAFVCAVHRRHDVLLHRHVQEQAERLERARDRRSLAIWCGSEADEALAVEEDLAAGPAGRSPVTRLKSVVLPAPLGPITLTISPSPTCRSRSVDCRQAAERLAHAAQLEERARRPARSDRSPPAACRGSPGAGRPSSARAARRTGCRRVVLGSTTSRFSQTNAAR